MTSTDRSGAPWPHHGGCSSSGPPGQPVPPRRVRSERRTILYCASGGRSALAAETLQRLGYRNVAHLDGGLNRGGTTASRWSWDRECDREHERDQSDSHRHGTGRHPIEEELPEVADASTADVAGGNLITGRITRCGQPAAGIRIEAIGILTIGLEIDSRPCVKSTSTRALGSATTTADGTYSISYTHHRPTSTSARIRPRSEPPWSKAAGPCRHQPGND